MAIENKVEDKPEGKSALEILGKRSGFITPGDREMDEETAQKLIDARDSLSEFLRSHPGYASHFSPNVPEDFKNRCLGKRDDSENQEDYNC